MNDTSLETFDDEQIGWTGQRILGVAVVVLLFAFWIWAFSPWAPNNKADGISDKAYLKHANASCATMQATLNKLPRAMDTTTASARADVIAESEAPLATMIADLRAAATSLQGRDAELVGQWLDDWQTYSNDRQAYGVALRSDQRALFMVTQRGTGQITKTMDGFTRVNDLSNCLVPTDV
ncbi:MAG: hypothetical protein F2754_05645 [Actinobacteria bacterium]|uniref:Unannotated protein n=1 Tax=freshwater metagenome TaxID=449393 RepID=A0A6J7Q7X9_9ZZZZ|nr:hypothetical protein [Actinomycetota bacterium]MSX86853.1 hypothetical protein [Actinomycetota bacterium]MSY70634.1 hypothetical protein [Actinomycetota bacterium]